MQGAIAHLLEPIASQPAPQPQPPTLGGGGLPSGIVGNIVIVLADLDDPDKSDQDVDMNDDTLPERMQEQRDQAWQYGDLDLRRAVEEGLYKFHESIKSAR